VALPYAQLVERSGLGFNHRLIIEAIPEGARVLDVGCASGYVAAALAAKGATTVGIEPDPAMAAAAEDHCEHVYAVTVEEARELAELTRDRFDAVILGDVLEHLVDPWATLAWARSLLAPGGHVVVSLPNAAHWSVRWSLLRGRWDYADHGLMDRTHLRFFTQRTAHELAARAGLRLVDERYTPAQLPGEAFLARLRRGGNASEPAGAALAGEANGASAARPASTLSPPPRAKRLLPASFTRATLAARWPRLLAMQFVMTLEPDRR
jgi:methionine biosynthesis protein MetW